MININGMKSILVLLNIGFLFYSYLIEQNVCYLVLCERNYSKKLAFSFLEDLSQEFNSLYGKKVHQVSRPYSFIEFGKWNFNKKSSLIGVISQLINVKFSRQILTFKRLEDRSWTREPDETYLL